jgi:glycosyltransferase involved in cell wall biosynthesis
VASVRVAVNLRKFQPGEVGGIENYIRHVVGGLASDRQGTGHELTIFAQDLAIDAIRAFAPRAALRVVPRHACGLSIDVELDPGAYDVLLCPQMGLDPLTSVLPSVAMIPDLAHRIVPTIFDPVSRAEREDLVAGTVAHADLILTPSNYSRDTLIDMYGVGPERIAVTYCGVDAQFTSRSREAPSAFAELGIPDTYLYFPANFWEHKNHANLLAAFVLLADSHPDVQLLLTGAPATGAERVRDLIDTLGLTGRVRMLGYQPTEVVAALTRHARAVVFPTLFEGFGIPPLEAFHTDTPVLASGAAGNLEVVGDAALLVDPGDPRSIADGIDRILTDEALRADLVARGRERTALFSWSRTVAVVERSLREIASKSPPSGTRTLVREPTRVSVVTPVLADARFLNETIDSVLAQEYPYVDYLVLDIGARAGSLELLHAYSDRVRWYSRPLDGEAQAINEGYRQTRGDLFAILAAGDLYGPDTLWRAVAHYDVDPSVAVVFGEVNDMAHRDSDAPQDPTRARADTVRDETGDQRSIFPSAAFVKRDAFERAGMLDPADRTVCIDRMWPRIARRGGTFRYLERRLATLREPAAIG